jgi:hypothetical protein
VPDPPWPFGDPWPSEPSPTARQDHAVLAWLVTEADLPNAVHGHLVDALVAWAPLMGEHLFPTEPKAGVDADLRQVLERMWWRLDAQATDARWVDKVVLNEVRGRVGLALQALRPLRPLRPPARRVPEPRSPGG